MPFSPSFRRAVTLLEVLISMFVLMVGMLGVAALLPVGRYTIVETAKADRSAALGRAAMRDARVRGMLDPRRWAYPDLSNSGGNPKVYRAIAFTDPEDRRQFALGETLLTYNPSDPRTYNLGGAFVIDPLFLSQVAVKPPRITPMGDCNPLRFPYMVDREFPPRTIPRVSVTVAPFDYYQGDPIPAQWSRTSPVFAQHASGVPVFWDYETAERVMRSADDVMFYMPSDPTGRPTQLYPQQRGQVRFSTAPDLIRASMGEYSWMLSVSPVIDPQFDQNLTTSRLYHVSVVVFHNRDLTAPDSSTLKPSERMVELTVSSSRNDLVGFGWGGGDVRMVFPAQASFEYAEVIPGQWIAMMARYRFKPDPHQRSALNLQQNWVSIPVCKWYRVIQVSPVLNQPNQRLVTLTGPDWPKINDPSVSADPSVACRNPYDPRTIRAVLVSNVVGVYTEAVQLDQLPQWR